MNKKLKARLKRSREINKNRREQQLLWQLETENRPQKPRHALQHEWDAGLKKRAEIYNIAKQNNVKLAFPRDWFKNLGVRVKCVCKECNFKWKPTASAFLLTPYCKECAEKKKQIESIIPRRRYYYIKHVKRVLRMVPGTKCPNIDNIKGIVGEKVKIICDRGHEWFPELKYLAQLQSINPQIMNLIWCPQCRRDGYNPLHDQLYDLFLESRYYPELTPGNAKFTFKRLQRLAKYLGCKLLEHEMYEKKTRYQFQCMYCGKIFKKSVNTIVSGTHTINYFTYNEQEIIKRNEALIRNGFCSKKCYHYHIQTITNKGIICRNRNEDFPLQERMRLDNYPYIMTKNGDILWG